MKETELKKTVRKLLVDSTTTGYCEYFQTPYVFTQPSDKKYPWQFFWDTCIHVIVMCNVDLVELAQQNLDSLFKAQHDNGAIGHMVYWEESPEVSALILTKSDVHDLTQKTTIITQPTILARAIKEVFEKTQDKKWLRRVLPKADQYFTWLLERDVSGDGLLSIICPLESGMDDKPTINLALGLDVKAEKKVLNVEVEKRVNLKNFLLNYDMKKIQKDGELMIEEVCFNTLYALDLERMGDLYDILGNDTKAKKYHALSKKVGKAIISKLYDPKDKAFYDYDARKKEHLKVLTPTIFFPILLPQIQSSVAKEIIEAHLLNKDEFYTTYPIPSVAINHPAFNPVSNGTLWRGPTWIVHIWLLFETVYKLGYKDFATYWLDQTIHMVEKSGFRENYNTLTGEGYGAPQFTWSTLLVDILEKNKKLYSLEK